jgi:hypothetical protein
MRNLEAKSRMLSFRLSRGEYEQAEEASRLQGYRSVALFARSAVLACTDREGGSYASQIGELYRKVRHLEAELTFVSESFATLGRTIELLRGGTQASVNADRSVRSDSDSN